MRVFIEVETRGHVDEVGAHLRRAQQWADEAFKGVYTNGFSAIEDVIDDCDARRQVQPFR
jgi:hypothetical protein